MEMSKYFQGTRNVSKKDSTDSEKVPKKSSYVLFFHGKLSRVRLRIILDKKIKTTLKQNMTTTGF